MRRFSLVFVVLALAVLGNAQVLRSQVEAMNKAVASAMMKRDADAFVRAIKPHVTKDFKYMEQGRTETFDVMAAGIKGGFAMMTKVTTAESKILSLSEKGNTATVQNFHNMEGISLDAKQKPHKLGFSGTSIDTYRKVNGKWLMSGMSWKNQKMTMDGKPFAQPKGSAG